MKPQAPLLGVEKHAHQSPRLIAENPPRQWINLPVNALESVHELPLKTTPAVAEQFAKGRQPPLRMRQERKPLFERAGDEVNVPHVAVEVAHEPFEPLDRRTVGITKIVRDGRLKTLGQHVGRAVDVVMQVIACAQEKIVSGFELFPLTL